MDKKDPPLQAHPIQTHKLIFSHHILQCVAQKSYAVLSSSIQLHHSQFQFVAYQIYLNSIFQVYFLVYECPHLLTLPSNRSTTYFPEGDNWSVVQPDNKSFPSSIKE